MILKALTLENFKGIREPVRIEFAPLTLLFGPNNAGKSTIVQALMYAREVLERNNCDAGRTELGGDVVDLGGFVSLAHLHDPTRPIRMRFELAVTPGALAAHIDADDLADSDEDEESEKDGRNTRIISTAFMEACAVSTDVWVELEIARVGIRSQPLLHAPTVKRYCVGSGTIKYAEITVDDYSGQARLSFLNNSMFPVVGTRYLQSDQSDFEWDLSRIARAKLRQAIKNNDVPKIGLKKGALVAIDGELLQHGDNRMSRQDFDTWVSQFVSGEGLWGDSTIDPATGEHNPKYRIRQELAALAEAAGRLRAAWCKWRTDQPPIPPEGTEEWIEYLFDLGPFEGPSGSEDARDLTRSGLLSPYHVEEKEEFDGPLLIPMHLTTRGTALPEWNESLKPFQEDERLQSQEFLIRSLSPLIARPGKLVLDALQHAVYLGPYRRLPSRQYRLQDAPDAPDWASGLAAWQLLTGEGNQPLVDRANSWLSKSNIGFRTDYSIAVHRYKSLQVDSSLWHDLTSGDMSVLAESIREQLAELPEEAKKLEFRNVNNGVTLAPQDLGVGISQLIPVLVAALHNAGGLVAIEEPESNIHPAFHVVLADLFITQAEANPDVLFLVETHSEHLMLRCLRRIRETAKGIGRDDGTPSVTPRDIAVHFVEPTEDGPRIHRIEIDDDGDFIDEWPGGFFEGSYEETFAGR